jgi:hypothetical protein
MQSVNSISEPQSVMHTKSESESRMSNNGLLVLVLLDKHLACFSKRSARPWAHEPIHGEAWYPLPTEGGLSLVLEELAKRLNHSDRLAGFEIHLVAARGAVPRLSSIGDDLAQRGRAIA